MVNVAAVQPWSYGRMHLGGLSYHFFVPFAKKKIHSSAHTCAHVQMCAYMCALHAHLCEILKHNFKNRLKF